MPVIADLIRNPVSVWHWIPDRVRDDNWRPGMTNAGLGWQLFEADLLAVVA